MQLRFILIYSEIERLLRDGKIYVEFRYAWHSVLRYVHLLASRHGDIVKVKRLINDILKHGANPNNRGDHGVTGLMLTCKLPNDLPWCLDNEAGQQLVENVVSLLLQYGAEVNQQDFYGCTALHYALKSIDANSNPSETRLARGQRVVQILIQHNANIYLKDSSGLSAIDMAKRAGHESWLKTDEASLTGTCSKKRKRSCSEEN
jgi:ankyrin repeat protein